MQQSESVIAEAEDAKLELGSTRPSAATQGDQLIRIYVWELPVRLIHWIIVFSIMILSITGYYIHNPFITLRNYGFTMGLMRFIHEVTAFVFTIAFLGRMYWFFVGNRFANWQAFFPWQRSRLVGIGTMLRYYLFLRWQPPSEIGHNPLAALAYVGVYFLILIQILTGFALYAWIVGTSPWIQLFGWMPAWISIQNIRLIHFLLMFVFFAFTIHHVYSGLLVAAELGNGLMGSIVSGYKFVTPAQLAEDKAQAREPAIWDGFKFRSRWSPRRSIDNDSEPHKKGDNP